MSKLHTILLWYVKKTHEMHGLSTCTNRCNIKWLTLSRHIELNDPQVSLEFGIRFGRAKY